MSTVSTSRTYLQQLVIDIDEARATVVVLRGETEYHRRKLLTAQARLRRLLETYDDLMSALGLPLPHRLRVELNVYRSLMTEAEAVKRSSHRNDR